ncbi:MAG: carboxypeptidase-like regulatory domain-containing protein, partial [Tenuifilaceae bacterium]|nr:carboxypeptidase-like regulatory domain-containing protein [Tenuifilaceae bacterium]
MKYMIITYFALFIGTQALAQHTMQGYISDTKTGEKLIGCSVYISSTTEGVTSNNYGFYSIKTNKLPARLVFSYIGYISDTLEF